MRSYRIPLVVAAMTVGCFAGAAIAAEPVPCEDALKELKAAEANAQLSDADKGKVADLQNQGIERCKADDDEGADEFFAQAMTIMGK